LPFFGVLFGAAGIGAPGEWFPTVLSATFVGADVITLAWLILIRPRYVRVAPGIVQFLTFHFTRRKPKIRSYPIEAGTIVVALPSGVFCFCRGANRDDLNPGGAKRPIQRPGRVGRAFLSTNLTPPLSDELLIG